MYAEHNIRLAVYARLNALFIGMPMTLARNKHWRSTCQGVVMNGDNIISLRLRRGACRTADAAQT